MDHISGEEEHIMKRKLLATVLCMTMAITIFTGCGTQKEDETAKTTEAAENETGGNQEATVDEETEGTKRTADTDTEGAVSGSGSDVRSIDGEYVIGISQFAQHGSLDNCREGFIEGLRQEGIVEGINLTLDYQNAEADTSIVNQIAQMFVSMKADMICAIATPSAQSAYNAAKETDIPTIFTAVTDPVAAGLASEDGTPVGEVTGTSDKLPVEAQLKMIREILPEAKTIGIMYTTSEVNSESTIAEYEQAVKEYGFTLEVIGVSALTDVPAATDTLLEKVDCLNNLTDNTVVSALPTILEKANAKNIPVFGSEIEQVRIGCLASEGIEYYQLGIRTGIMAAKVLKGEVSAGALPYEIIQESNLYLNTKVAENLGITISEDAIGRAVETFTEIEQ